MRMQVACNDVGGLPGTPFSATVSTLGPVQSLLPKEVYEVAPLLQPVTMYESGTPHLEVGTVTQTPKTVGALVNEFTRLAALQDRPRYSFPLR